MESTHHPRLPMNDMARTWSFNNLGEGHGMPAASNLFTHADG